MNTFLEDWLVVLIMAALALITFANVLALRATEHDILLGPGHLFSPGLEPSPWLRFNIAFCEDEAVFDFLQQEIARAEAGRCGLTNY